MILLRVSRLVLLSLVALQLAAGGALVHVHGDTGQTHAAFSGNHSHASAHDTAHSHNHRRAEATRTDHHTHKHACGCSHHHHDTSHQHPEPKRAPNDDRNDVQLASLDAHSHFDCRSAVNDFPGCGKAPSLTDTVDIAPAAILPPVLVVAGFGDAESVRTAPPTGPPDTPPLPFYLIHQNLRL